MEWWSLEVEQVRVEGKVVVEEYGCMMMTVEKVGLEKV